MKNQTLTFEDLYEMCKPKGLPIETKEFNILECSDLANEPEMIKIVITFAKENEQYTLIANKKDFDVINGDPEKRIHKGNICFMSYRKKIVVSSGKKDVPKARSSTIFSDGSSVWKE